MSNFVRGLRCQMVAVMCSVLLISGESPAAELNRTEQQAAAPEEQAPKIPNDQLDSLVAPIALYPDPLLAQVLAASTYPLEIMQLQQWLGRNKNLKDKELADAVAKQPWDPTVQALAALPDVVKRLADDIQWTTDLGNAFLAQPSDVMDAVQRMRKKAEQKGTLKTTEQQKVENTTVDGQSVVVIEQANPQVVYVPSYDPVVVYGAPVYPYPPIYYPPPGYYAAGMAISFGIGVAMGAFWGGGWGWNCGWGGGGNVYVNHNNYFNRNTNVGGGNRNNIGGGNRWQHRPEHRGGAPYRDRSTADRFGGTTRGDSLANRQNNARRELGRQAGTLPSNRPGAALLGDRGGGLGNRTGAGNIGNRPGGGNVGNRPGAGGPNSIGNRDLSRQGGGNRNAFAGGTRGYNGSNARASGNRGSQSMRQNGGSIGGGRSGAGGFSGARGGGGFGGGRGG